MDEHPEDNGVHPMSGNDCLERHEEEDMDELPRF
jgi:hypothetical protein